MRLVVFLASETNGKLGEKLREGKDRRKKFGEGERERAVRERGPFERERERTMEGPVRVTAKEYLKGETYKKKEGEGEKKKRGELD